MGLFDKLFKGGDKGAQGASTPPKARRPARGGHTPPAPAQVVSPDWRNGTPTLRSDGHLGLSGESFYQEALTRHLADAGPLRLVTAQLVRDRDNPYHEGKAGAVAVFLGADPIGYLHKSSLVEGRGRLIYNALDRLSKSGRPATAWAHLMGGAPDKPSVGCALIMAYDDKPDEPFDFEVTLPAEGFHLVKGAAEQHQDVLAQLAGRRVDTYTYHRAELAPSTDGTGGIVVRLGGTEVGGLTPKAAEPWLAHLEALAAVGRPALALARIKPRTGNAVGLNCSVSLPNLN